MSRYTDRTDTGAPIERTGWRDKALKRYVDEYIGGIMPNDNRGISMWHREALDQEGMAVDIDFMLLEHRYGDIAAAMEFKRREPTTKNIGSVNNYKAIMNLCNNSNVPFFVVFYKGDFSEWTVVSFGKETQRLYGKGAKYQEEGFVNFCYELRGIPMPRDIRKKIRSGEWNVRKKSLLQEAARTDARAFIQEYGEVEGYERVIAEMKRVI